MKGFGKRLLICGLCLVFALVSLGATGQSMTLHTTVPGQVQLELRLKGQGSVRIGDDVFRASTTIRLPYSSALEIQVQPDRGTFVKRILWNGVDITDTLRDGSLTLMGPGAENELQVIFQTTKLQGDNPATGDIGVLHATILEFGTAAGLVLLYRTRKKICKSIYKQK